MQPSYGSILTTVLLPKWCYGFQDVIFYCISQACTFSCPQTLKKCLQSLPGGWWSITSYHHNLGHALVLEKLLSGHLLDTAVWQGGMLQSTGGRNRAEGRQPPKIFWQYVGFYPDIPRQGSSYHLPKTIRISLTDNYTAPQAFAKSIVWESNSTVLSLRELTICCGQHRHAESPNTWRNSSLTFIWFPTAPDIATLGWCSTIAIVILHYATSGDTLK